MSALTGYKKYGVSKNLLHHNIVNYFHLTEEYQECLLEYYILHWERKYLSNQIVDGTIKHKGRKFIVVYNACGHADLKLPGNVRLSFRVPQLEFNIKNYVLVKLTQIENKGD